MLFRTAGVPILEERWAEIDFLGLNRGKGGNSKGGGKKKFNYRLKGKGDR